MEHYDEEQWRYLSCQHNPPQLHFNLFFWLLPGVKIINLKISKQIFCFTSSHPARLWLLAARQHWDKTGEEGRSARVVSQDVLLLLSTICVGPDLAKTRTPALEVTWLKSCAVKEACVLGFYSFQLLLLLVFWWSNWNSCTWLISK